MLGAASSRRHAFMKTQRRAGCFPRGMWAVDSGAFPSSTREPPGHFADFRNETDTIIAAGGPVTTLGSGTSHGIPNTTCTPSLPIDGLASVSQACDAGHELLFTRTHAIVGRFEIKDEVMRAERHGGLYLISPDEYGRLFEPPSEKSVLLSDATHKNRAAIAHRRYNHVSWATLKWMRDHGHLGLKFTDEELKAASAEICAGCSASKLTAPPTHKKSTSSAPPPSEPGTFVDIDIGEVSSRDRDGHKYFLIVVDRATTRIFVYLLKRKSDAFDAFLEFREQLAADPVIQNKPATMHLTCLRSDNDTVFQSAKWWTYCENAFIEQQFSDRYTGHAHRAERAIRSMREAVLAILTHSPLPRGFWGYALRHAAYTHGFIAPKAPGVTAKQRDSEARSQSPREQWYRRPVDTSHLRAFGSPCCVHLPRERRSSNMDPRSVAGYMVGYNEKRAGEVMIFIPSEGHGGRGRVASVPQAAVAFDENKALQAPAAEPIDDATPPCSTSSASESEDEPSSSGSESTGSEEEESGGSASDSSSSSSSGGGGDDSDSGRAPRVRFGAALSDTASGGGGGDESAVPPAPSSEGEETERDGSAEAAMRRLFDRIRDGDNQSSGGDSGSDSGSSSGSGGSRASDGSDGRVSRVMQRALGAERSASDEQSDESDGESSDGPAIRDETWREISAHNHMRSGRVRRQPVRLNYGQLGGDDHNPALLAARLSPLRVPACLKNDMHAAFNRHGGGSAFVGVTNERGEPDVVFRPSVAPSELAGAVFADQIRTPKNYREAMASDEHEHWQAAIDKELAGIARHEVFQVIKRSEVPRGRRLIKGKFVFKCKCAEDGKLSVFKARLVALGCLQIAGLDYDQTFAPTARATSIRLLLSIAAMYDLELFQFDVCHAFLGAPLKEDIYMGVPEGVPGIPEGHVIKLGKSIYGLKQSAAQFWYEIDSHLQKIGFVPSAIDPCLYVRKDKGDDSYSLLTLCVDDMIVATNMKSKDLLNALEQRFEMQDLGNVEYVLGMKIRRDRENRHIYVSQQAYIEKALRTFRMDGDEVKSAATPGSHGRTLSKENCGKWKNERERPPPYRELIGTLMYAMVTRLDIALACSVAARFCENPGEEHWEALKQILRYLKGTKELEMRLGGRRPVAYYYSDADNGGTDNAKPTDTHISVSGGIGFFGDGPVEAYARKQHVPSISTCEAEFRAASTAVQGADAEPEDVQKAIGSYLSLCSSTCGALALRSILKEIGLEQTDPTPVFVDNKSCKAAMINPINKKLRHVNVKVHRVRFAIRNGDVVPIWLPTDYMIADILTKNLPGPKFRYFRDLILGYPVPDDANDYAGEPKPHLPPALKKKLGY